MWRPRSMAALAGWCAFAACGGGSGTPPGGGPPDGVITSWDGASCPSGTKLAPIDPIDLYARWCEAGGVPSGPYGRWFSPGPDAGGAVEVLGTYSAGLRSGDWTWWFEPETADAEPAVRRTGAYAAGSRTGVWREWDGEGEVWEQGGYVDDARDGEWTVTGAGGELRERRRYAAGLATGEWTVLGAGGLVLERTSWVAGVRDGAYERFYANGVRAEAGEYADDLREGAWQSWYPGGQLQESGVYDRGLRQGTWAGSTVEGWPDYAGGYDAGERVGAWTLWDYQFDTARYRRGAFVEGSRGGEWTTWWAPSGEPAASDVQSEVEHYADGLLEGPFHAWWPGGQDLSDGAYAGGEQHGAWTLWYEDGVVAAELVYVLGTLASSACWDEQGLPVECDEVL
jgi:antitoxin component YwqK of YwqJK toxin-antitoxin module